MLDFDSVFESLPVLGGGRSGGCVGRLDSSNAVGSAVIVGTASAVSRRPNVGPRF